MRTMRAQARPAALGLALLCAAALAPPARAASLSAAPDRFVVTAGETFDLILSLTDGDSREPPDVSALTRDFDIVERRRASRAEMVKGKPAHVDQWIMTLQPKRTGTLTLPPLSLGGLTSAPAQVQVVPASGKAELDDDPLFVRLEAAATPAFAQSDIPVTIRIYDSVGMRAGAMDKPTADGATFTPDGGQRSYVKTLGKRRYRVIEQSYLMRPQKSGVIEIPPVTLSATLPGFRGSSAASDLPNVLGRSPLAELAERTVAVRSQPLSISVQPRPAGASGWFLPARSVTLAQSWSTPPDALKVGDTVTRTVTLGARGASPNQLPPLEPPAVDGVRQYREDTSSGATLIGGEAGAIVAASFSIVPTRAGEITLPAIEVPWWNLATQRQETAILPAVTLKVRPGAESALPAPPAAPPAATAPADTPNGAAEGDRAEAVSGSLLDALREHRTTASLGIALLAGALVLLAWRRRRRRVMVANATRGATNLRRRRGPLSVADPARLRADLAAACRRNDARAAHGAVTALTRSGVLDPRDPELAAASEALARHLYGVGAAAWDGRALLAALERLEKRTAKGMRRPRGARLAPLYPAPR